MKKIEFAAKNVKAFSSWLKKFASIDKGLLLEIDESESLFIAKTYNEERSVVKFSKIKFDEAGFVVKKSADPKRVKVGIYNIIRLMKVMDQFNDQEFSFIVNYDEITGDTTEWAGISLIFKNKTLKVNVDCISLNIFKYISDELFNDTIAAIDNKLAKFKLSQEIIEKTNSLNALDNDYKFMEFKKSSNIYVSSQMFDLLVEELQEKDEKENTINIFKEQFNSIDSESYNVIMGEDRLVFNSEDSSTIIVISMVEKD